MEESTGQLQVIHSQDLAFIKVCQEESRKKSSLPQAIYGTQQAWGTRYSCQMRPKLRFLAYMQKALRGINLNTANQPEHTIFHSFVQSNSDWAILQGKMGNNLLTVFTCAKLEETYKRWVVAVITANVNSKKDWLNGAEYRNHTKLFIFV